ncbi:histidine kinase [Malaciobacter molluscorum LMG 25693]|uniref:histidine kinase n=2 Tax=Arcobacteraceae TaxID=2808963 RepID=A0A2G1DGK2_9BACT|nr:cache domain-containing protein [Malaciobacter molluscorum]AXX92501.1 Cache sensor-containing signal transduction histidine kinase [Malaciobacter molluscorum LMG 25693]PHO17629.1 histidine kinase [Malaciobacter molluscorum LMG 25693]
MSRVATENKLIKIIKYVMPIATIIISLIFTTFIVFSNIDEFKKESKNLKESYIVNQKKLVKSEVLRVYNELENEHKKVKEFIKNDIKNRVNEAYKISLNIYKEHHNESKKKILKLIKDSLRAIKFNNDRGYFVINDLEGNTILYPPKRSVEGKNYLNIKDNNGFYFMREIIREVKEKHEGYIEFNWKIPSKNDDIFYKKTVFFKEVKPLGIYISTGEYISEYEKSVKKKLIKRLQNLRYGLNKFVFLVDYDGIYLSHLKDEYVGKNRIDLKDKNGFYITKEIINTAKRGEGFISYISTVMPETNLPASKTSFVKGFDKWNIAVASGFYNQKIDYMIEEKKQELDEKNRKYIYKMLTFSLLIAFILFAISLYVSTYLEKYFLKYRKKIYKEVEKNKKKDILLAHQSKMVAMGEMMENIAHQWRQPLSIITTCASGMQLNKQLGLLTDESQDKSIEIILSNANHLSQTIDDFRDFLNNKKEKKEFDLQNVYKKTLKIISSKLESNNVKLSTHIEEVVINGYENELIQVLMNFFNNSLDAFKINNVENRQINLKIYKSANFAYFDYSDNAGGIKQEYLNKIFEPYFTTKHQYNGTGIGLYMSQQIITKHFNANIEVKNIIRNTKTIGVRFTVKIPFQ